MKNRVILTVLLIMFILVGESIINNAFAQYGDPAAGDPAAVYDGSADPAAMPRGESVGVASIDDDSQEFSADVMNSIQEQVNNAQAIDVTDAERVPAEIASKYTLGANDIIEVVVMRHPEVSGQYVVNSEGKIQYEFVGDVNVNGKTKQDVSDMLKYSLSQYIIEPEVTVKIVGYNSKVVYVVGEVASPGKIFMRGDTITVREALIQAGLPLLTAKTTKGALITPSESGSAKKNKKKINIHKLLYEGDLRENLVMKPGDTLYVPATGLAKVMRTIQPVAAPIGTAAGTGRTVTTGF